MWDEIERLFLHPKMAENKKSFLLYCDLIHTVKQLPSDKAGELFKHILRYVNDENPVTDDLLINVTFEPIKQSLKRDLIKWEKFIDKQRLNGAKGGRPKTQKTQAFISKPKKPVSVSVNDTVIDKERKKKTNVFNAPSYEDFMIYAVSQYKSKEHYLGFKQNLTRKYNTWKENGWINERTQKPIKRWKATLGNTIPFIPKDN